MRSSDRPCAPQAQLVSLHGSSIDASSWDLRGEPLQLAPFTDRLRRGLRTIARHSLRARLTNLRHDQCSRVRRPINLRIAPNQRDAIARSIENPSMARGNEAANGLIVLRGDVRPELVGGIQPMLERHRMNSLGVVGVGAGDQSGHDVAV